MTINIRLPDFGVIVKEVTEEILVRVERRTPRSAKDKEHLQDQWHIDQVGENHQAIVNDFPYAGFVENGTSKMSGAHMVAQTREEIPDIISDVLKNHFEN